MSQDNEITGVIDTILPAEEISNGKYKKKVFVVKNNDGYEGREQLFAFELFEKSDGERIKNFMKFNKEGQTVTVKFDIRCSENNGRYFTSLSAYRIDKAEDPGGDDVVVDKPMEEEISF